MALKSSYPSREAALADIASHGFSPGLTPGYFGKKSTLHDGTPCVALVVVTEQVVDPIYGKPNYFTVDFK